MTKELVAPPQALHRAETAELVGFYALADLYVGEVLKGEQGRPEERQNAHKLLMVAVLHIVDPIELPLIGVPRGIVNELNEVYEHALLYGAALRQVQPLRSRHRMSGKEWAGHQRILFSELEELHHRSNAKDPRPPKSFLQKLVDEEVIFRL